MKLAAICFLIALTGCTNTNSGDVETINPDTSKTIASDSAQIISINSIALDTATIIREVKNDTGLIVTDAVPAQLLLYAQSLIGTPYKFASANPKEGFDCSGFITHVFNHFNITVPRSSVDFTNYGTPVATAAAKPADLILFTGTDSSSTRVGHMGIIVKNEKEDMQFIHSTSGKAFGVTVTPLNKYYKQRFVKIIRVFN